MQGGESCVENLAIGRLTVTLEPSLRNCGTMKFTLTEGFSGLVDCFATQLATTLRSSGG